VAKHILSGNNRRTAVSMQRKRKHAYITIGDLQGYGIRNVFSVRGQCRRFTGDNEGHLQSVVEREAEWRQASAVKIDCEL
jgi:hypothetical protein